MMSLETKTNEDTILIKTAALPPVRIIESDEQFVPDDERAGRTRAEFLLPANELAKSQARIIGRFNQSLFESSSGGKLEGIGRARPCPLLPDSMLVDVLALHLDHERPRSDRFKARSQV